MMCEDDAPFGSVESSDRSRPGWAEAPAAWKLNNWTFMADQSVKFVAAACSRKARSYDNQTRPANWRCVRRIKSWYCSKSLHRCGKWDDKMRLYTEKASNQLAMSPMRRLGFLGGEVNTNRPSNSS